MIKFLLVSILTFAVDPTCHPPRGWISVERTSLENNESEVFFFDYMSRLEELEPDFLNTKGRQQTDLMQNVTNRFPVYLAEVTKKNTDSVYYFFLRPNKKNVNESPFWFDFVTVGYTEKVSLSTFEDTASYKDHIVSVDNAIGCRGSIVYEHNVIIQKSTDKDKAIGNGIQIAEGIFVRVIPYAEIKRPFFKLIERKL